LKLTKQFALTVVLAVSLLGMAKADIESPRNGKTGVISARLDSIERPAMVPALLNRSVPQPCREFNANGESASSLASMVVDRNDRNGRCSYLEVLGATVEPHQSNHRTLAYLARLQGGRPGNQSAAAPRAFHATSHPCSTADAGSRSAARENSSTMGGADRSGKIVGSLCAVQSRRDGSPDHHAYGSRGLRTANECSEESSDANNFYRWPAGRSQAGSIFHQFRIQRPVVSHLQAQLAPAPLAFSAEGFSYLVPVARWQWWHTVAHQRTGSAQLGHATNSGAGGCLLSRRPSSTPNIPPNTKTNTRLNSSAVPLLASMFLLLGEHILQSIAPKVNAEVA
jgi:hypothetical protein